VTYCASVNIPVLLKHSWSPGSHSSLIQSSSEPQIANALDLLFPVSIIKIIGVENNINGNGCACKENIGPQL
jgi:hypothetical protein